jgi:hypothetical protein
MVDVLILLPNNFEPIEIHDQTTIVHLITLQLEWLLSVYEYLLEGMMPKKFTTS